MTRAIAATYMVNFDKELIEKIKEVRENSDEGVLSEHEMILEILGRYIDNIFLTMAMLRAGLRFKNNKMVMR